MTKTKRLLSLDVMRGIAIAGMILVNNPGSWGSVYAPLAHAKWNGLTPTDLVFPFFMFIMGVSMDFSLRQYDGRLSKDAFIKIIRRTVVIFLIGLGLAWFSKLCGAMFNIGNTEMSFGQRLVENLFPFKTIRILGVMQRLALCYFGGAILSFIVKPKYFLQTAFCILAIYAVILLLGHGFVLSEENIIAVVDRAVIGVNHMYREWVPATATTPATSIPFDPEGLLSTLPCISHVMLGMFVGRIILKYKDNGKRIQQLFVFGTILLFSGLLLSYGIPINKKIWSPTFVLTTCGFGAQFLSLLIWIIDMKGKVAWSRFFESFGINPLFMYVLAAVLATLLGNIRFFYNGDIISVRSFIYDIVLVPVLGNYPASLAYALLFVGFNWIIGYQLYKRRIYIKI